MNLRLVIALILVSIPAFAQDTAIVVPPPVPPVQEVAPERSQIGQLYYLSGLKQPLTAFEHQTLREAQDKGVEPLRQAFIQLHEARLEASKKGLEAVQAQLNAFNEMAPKLTEIQLETAMAQIRNFSGPILSQHEALTRGLEALQGWHPMSLTEWAIYKKKSGFKRHD